MISAVCAATASAGMIYAGMKLGSHTLKQKEII